MDETPVVGRLILTAWPTVVVICIAIIVVGLARLHAASLAEERQVAFAAAPPCAATTSEALAARHIRLDKVFSFQGIEFARQFGQAQCSATQVARRFHFVTARIVCQFSNPLALEVRTGKIVRAYTLKPRQGATITFKDGELTCAADSDTSVLRVLDRVRAG